MATVGPRRHDDSPSGAGDASKLLSGQRWAWEEVEPVRAVSRGEHTVSKRKLGHIRLDVHRPIAEAAASAPQHLSAEIDGDDERTTRSAREGFPSEETGPGGNVQDQARGDQVRQQSACVWRSVMASACSRLSSAPPGRAAPP